MKTLARTLDAHRPDTRRLDSQRAEQFAEAMVEIQAEPEDGWVGEVSQYRARLVDGEPGPVIVPM